MNIIFQAGSFCNENNAILSSLCSIISALAGAIISGLIAIHIFNKGLKKEKKRKKEEYISESNDLEQYFFHNIDSINFYINKQIDEISQCSIDIKDWNKNDFPLSIFPELSTKDFWEINQKKIYKIFVSNRIGDIKQKAEDFISFRNCLYRIDNFIITQTELNKKISQRLFVNNEHWNQSLKNLLNLSNSFAIEHNNNNNNGDAFLKLFTDLMVNKQRELIKNKTENKSIVFNKLIVPLKKYFKDNPKNYDKRMKIISEQLINIQEAYDEITYLRDERQKNISNSKLSLVEIQKLLNKSISNTKKRIKEYK